MTHARQSNMELLRIVAMCMIIMFHFSDHNALQIKGTMDLCLDWLVLAFARIGGAFGNCVFVMLTGFFMWNKGLRLRNLFRLWQQVLFYSVGSAILCYVFQLGGEHKFNIILKSFTPVFNCTYWYVSNYIVLLFLMPYLNKGIAGMSRSVHKKLIYMLIFMFSVLHTITGIEWILGSNVIPFVNLYLIGAYIGKYKVRGAKDNSCNFKFMLITAIVMFLTIVVRKYTNPERDLFRFVWGFEEFLPTLMAIYGLIFFSRIKIATSKCINGLSSTVFGCYMFHIGMIWPLFFLDWFDAGKYYGSGLVLGQMIVAVVTILLLSCIIDLLRQSLIEKPLMGMLKERLDCLENKMVSWLERKLICI